MEFATHFFPFFWAATAACFLFGAITLDENVRKAGGWRSGVSDAAERKLR